MNALSSSGKYVVANITTLVSPCPGKYSFSTVILLVLFSWNILSLIELISFTALQKETPFSCQFCIKLSPTIAVSSNMVRLSKAYGHMNFVRLWTLVVENIIAWKKTRHVLFILKDILLLITLHWVFILKLLEGTNLGEYCSGFVSFSTISWTMPIKCATQLKTGPTSILFGHHL